MPVSYFIIALLVLGAVGVYSLFYLLRAARFWKLDPKKRWVKIVIGILVFAAALCCANLFSFQALVILHILAFSLFFDLLHCIFHAVLKKRKKEEPNWYKTVYNCGLLPVFCAALVLLYGFWNMGQVQETDYTVHTQKPIREEGYEIAMISDLHYGTTMQEETLGKYCHKIEEKKPDFIVLCGDIFDENTTLEELKESAAILGSMKSPLGTFYVFGNHDKARYSNHPYFTGDVLEKELTENGITVLEDETVPLNEEIVVVGRKDRSFSGEEKRKSMKNLTQNRGQEDFLLVLDHQPAGFQENEGVGVDLQLSGHTHAGQMFPVGLITDLMGYGELNYGYKKIGNFQVIVSSGIGGWGYSIRTGSHSEYVMIKLTH